MNCSKCNEKAIYSNCGMLLCKNHFLSYFEAKVIRTINRYGLIKKNDIVCVATSGGKDSLAVLFMTMVYCRRNKIDFFALAIDEGISGYRDATLTDLRKFCGDNGINLHVVQIKETMGVTLDEMKESAIKEFGKKPCTVCGILRRSFLNKNARKLGATKLVTGHNLDDESQSFMMNTLLGNMRHNAAMGPITGLSENSMFVPREKPLYFVSEKETRLFALLKGFDVNFAECPNIGMSFRAVVRDALNEIEAKLPGAKNSIVNSFLEILPELKEKYKGKQFMICERCGEPCAGKICNACTLEEQLGVKRQQISLFSCGHGDADEAIKLPSKI